MTIGELIESGMFQLVHQGEGTEREISKPFCCDLLSIAMGKAPEGAVWVTVIGNVNTLAVATLTDVACLVLAEGAALDENAGRKAVEEGITVMRTEEPIFDAALRIWERIQ